MSKREVTAQEMLVCVTCGASSKSDTSRLSACVVDEARGSKSAIIIGPWVMSESPITSPERAKPHLKHICKAMLLVFKQATQQMNESRTESFLQTQKFSPSPGRTASGPIGHPWMWPRTEYTWAAQHSSEPLGVQGWDMTYQRISPPPPALPQDRPLPNLPQNACSCPPPSNSVLAELSWCTGPV